MIEVPAEKASLKLAHVEDCCCYRLVLPTADEDVKMIDARCIAAYLVPEGAS